MAVRSKAMPIQNTNGYHAGLLVAACVNRAPEGMIGAAVAEVGVLDLLKVCFYHL